MSELVAQLLRVVALFGILGAILSLTLPPLILLGFVLFFWKRTRQADALRAAAHSWPGAPGVVLASEVRINSGQATTLYPFIRYRYEVGGQVFEGTRIRAGDERLRIQMGDAAAYETVERHPIGASLTVFYNPVNPAESALER
jgi:hypothetical protein